MYMMDSSIYIIRQHKQINKEADEKQILKANT